MPVKHTLEMEHVLVTEAEFGFLLRNASAPYGMALAAVLTRAHCSCSMPSHLHWRRRLVTCQQQPQVHTVSIMLWPDHAAASKA
jgi:hypothetical protein